MVNVNPRTGLIYSGEKSPGDISISPPPGKGYKLRADWTSNLNDAWEYDLTSVIPATVSKIDEKTQELITLGFKFDNHTFSLSPHAQINWIALKNAYDTNTYTDPTDVSTIESNVYSLTKEKFPRFYLAAFSTVNNYLDSGRQLKVQANNATTPEEIANIVDNRTQLGELIPANPPPPPPEPTGPPTM